jgi:hypothetical protein
MVKSLRYKLVWDKKALELHIKSVQLKVNQNFKNNAY